MGSALLLLLDVAVRAPAAWIITGAVLAWFGICWLALPWTVLRTAERHQQSGHHGAERPPPRSRPCRRVVRMCHVAVTHHLRALTRGRAA
ncbi:hypothetical protein [Kitasatospora mediocidica]|uniref:hypothetical protein n=1 Tax=Kitasatospora mediocidica TaxID=58352 RepID=UPI0038BC0082